MALTLGETDGAGVLVQAVRLSAASEIVAAVSASFLSEPLTILKLPLVSSNLALFYRGQNVWLDVVSKCAGKRVGEVVVVAVNHHVAYDRRA